jgi:hypothetical protein
VIARDREEARAGAIAALASARESWEPDSTVDNLAMIRKARAQHGESVDWAGDFEDELKRRAEQLEEERGTAARR